MSACSYCKHDHPTPRSGTTGEQLPGPCISVLADQVEQVKTGLTDQIALFEAGLATIERKVEEVAQDVLARLDQLKLGFQGSPGSTPPPATPEVPAAPVAAAEPAAAAAPASTEPSST